MRFTTVLELGGKTATGIRVPEEVVAPCRGANMVAMSAENRALAAVAELAPPFPAA